LTLARKVVTNIHGTQIDLPFISRIHRHKVCVCVCVCVCVEREREKGGRDRERKMVSWVLNGIITYEDRS
jgi:hypothetical protein